jgi:hypothetical protein
LPNGAATNIDQLARDRPDVRLMRKIRPMLVCVQILKCQTKVTIIHEGKYTSAKNICVDLSEWLIRVDVLAEGRFDVHDSGRIEEPHGFHVRRDLACSFAGHCARQMIYNSQKRKETEWRCLNPTL